MMMREDRMTAARAAQPKMPPGTDERLASYIFFPFGAEVSSSPKMLTS